MNITCILIRVTVCILYPGLSTIQYTGRTWQNRHPVTEGHHTTKEVWPGKCNRVMGTPWEWNIPPRPLREWPEKWTPRPSWGTWETFPYGGAVSHMSEPVHNGTLTETKLIRIDTNTKALCTLKTENTPIPIFCMVRFVSVKWNKAKQKFSFGTGS